MGSHRGPDGEAGLMPGLNFLDPQYPYLSVKS